MGGSAAVTLVLVSIVRVAADILCAGENAPNFRWSQRHFTMLSYCFILAPEMYIRMNLPFSAE